MAASRHAFQYAECIGDSLGNLRWANAGRKYGVEDARAQLIAQGDDLKPRLLRTLLNLLAGAANTLLHVLPYLGKSCLTLCIPLLQLLIAGLKDLGFGCARL